VIGVCYHCYAEGSLTFCPQRATHCHGRFFLRVLGDLCDWRSSLSGFSLGLAGRTASCRRRIFSGVRAATGAAFRRNADALWINSSDAAITGCGAGAVLGLVAAAGLRQRVRGWRACWCVVSCGGGPGLPRVQWDYRCRSRVPGHVADHLAGAGVAVPVAALRLMFFTRVKLASGDALRGDRADVSLRTHQPTPLAGSCTNCRGDAESVDGLVLFVELDVPFLFRTGGWCGGSAAMVTVGLQVLILTTGNYGSSTG